MIRRGGRPHPAQRSGQAANELPAEHFGPLREALERTGGRAVKNLPSGRYSRQSATLTSLGPPTQPQGRRRNNYAAIHD
jgi:hypothetical protein